MTTDGFSYTIKRSSSRRVRKTISVCVLRNGDVEVRCGRNTSREFIESFIEEKSNWIQNKRAQMQQRFCARSAFSFDEGTLLRCCGRDYPLIFVDRTQFAPFRSQLRSQLRQASTNFGAAPTNTPMNNPANISIPNTLACSAATSTAGFNGNCFFVLDTLQHEEPNAIRNALLQVYKALAHKYLPARVQQLSESANERLSVGRSIFKGLKLCQRNITPLKPTGIRISSARTRWGSCSATNSLNFSFLLMMADPKCIDYVIYHELAHIHHHNHSAEFWALVEYLCPDYKMKKNELKQLSQQLALEPWFD